MCIDCDSAFLPRRPYDKRCRVCYRTEKSKQTSGYVCHKCGIITSCKPDDYRLTDARQVGIRKCRKCFLEFGREDNRTGRSRVVDRGVNDYEDRERSREQRLKVKCSDCPNEFVRKGRFDFNTRCATCEEEFRKLRDCGGCRKHVIPVEVFKSPFRCEACLPVWEAEQRRKEEEEREKKRRGEEWKQEAQNAMKPEIKGKFLEFLKEEFGKIRDHYESLSAFGDLRTAYDPYQRFFPVHGKLWMEKVESDLWKQAGDSDSHFDPKKILEWGVTMYDR